MNNEILILLNIKNKDLKVVEIKEEEIKKKKVTVVVVESTKKKVRCPECNNYTSSVHDRLNPIRCKYLDTGGVQCILNIKKRRFICHKCNKKFTEKLLINEAGKTLSNSLRIKIRKELLEYNLSIKYIAKINNVSDNTVRNELLDAMKSYPESIKLLPMVISFDEFKADTDEGKYAFIINDPIHKKTLEILPSRRKEFLMQYFTKVENRRDVKFIISDMYEPYLLVQKIMFPNAKYVVDRFHYIRYIMDALDKIRIRIEKSYSYNSKEYRLLKNKKNVSLLRKYGKEISWFVYDKRYRNGRMFEILPSTILDEIYKIDEVIKRGYQLKEMFLDIVNFSTYETATKEFMAWIELCKESNIPEFIQASNTINNWLEYIVNSFIDIRYSNGYTEGLNNKIKVIKRNGYGYKSFKFLRLRLLYILNGKLR
ncbi:ISL3 family transposase [Clostridium sp.]|uniref:ISL3 family transposase n=1 Tax=Clostridium sp. TaxID=1506 RepID=UPI002FCA0281